MNELPIIPIIKGKLILHKPQQHPVSITVDRRFNNLGMACSVFFRPSLCVPPHENPEIKHDRNEKTM
jgi:hypothetical protein